MSATVVLGWVMSVIGILFLLLAVAAASKNVLRRGAMVEEGAGRSSGIAEVLKYLAATLRELGKLPFWITCLLAGPGPDLPRSAARERSIAVRILTSLGTFHQDLLFVSPTPT